MKRFLYIFLFLITLSGLLSACKGNSGPDESIQTPKSSEANQPTETHIPNSSVTFIFDERESGSYLSLYHQLAYLKMQNAGYNVRSVNINEASDLQSVFAQLDGSGTDYAIATSGSIIGQAQLYVQDTNSNIAFIQYSDMMNTDFTEYNIKLYEYYYLAGIALCNESASKSAGFIADSPDEQTIRCINAFALGMKSVDIDSKVVVLWADDSKDAANISSLVSQLSTEGCDVFAYFMNGDLVEKAANAINAKYMTMSTHTFLNVDSNIAIKPSISLDIFYGNVIRQQIQGGFSYLGIRDGVVGYELSGSVSDETHEIMGSAYANLQNGYEVFSGPIYSKLGMIVPPDTSLPEEDILDMLWFVDNVVGELPAG